MSQGEPAAPLMAALAEGVRRLVEQAAAAARRRGLAAYVVGGAVRDWLLGRGPIHEVDVVVVGEAEPLADEVARQVGGRAVAFERFGTVRVVAAGVTMDFASARLERYPAPGALPEPAPAGSIEADLSRRDFTVNAMAVPLAGDPRPLVDPWGGREDLAARRLRALHPRSFEDDPTRLFRGVRLAVRYGLSVEPQTARWMRQALAGRALETVSAERRGQEVRRALSESPALPVAEAMEAWGLWDAACPGWHLQEPARRALAGADRAQAELVELLRALGGDEAAEDVWAVRLLAVAEPWLGTDPSRAEARAQMLAQRLALTRRVREALRRLPEAARVHRRLARVRRASTADRLLRDLPALVLAYLAVRGGLATPDYNWVGWYARTGRRIRPSLTGRDLLALGCPPGPAVGRLQEALRAAVLDGRVQGRAQERRWVERRLRTRRTAPADRP